ncbi:VOC family protein [Streptomyces sp. NPDC051561]|uniref:VOC family protein n=1 Tax=Streptomyces sp. NPDC051561 TaxID=3365658 RepID=UPI0037A3D88A
MMSTPLRPVHLSDRWFRSRPDSSTLSRPRLLARSLIDVADLDDHIAFYERLLGEPADLRMPIPDFGGLELAAIGNLLLIASGRPFTPVQRQTRYSLIVPSLAAQLQRLERTSTVVVESPEVIVPGARARVRYPDGVLAELVEHRPQPGEQPRPPTLSKSAERTSPAGRFHVLARKAVSHGAFADTVRLYETLLQTRAFVRKESVGTDHGQAALVGNLLLVGRPVPDPDEAPQPVIALIEPAPDSRRPQEPGLDMALDDLAARRFAGSTGPRTVTLAGPLTAEVWGVEAAQWLAPHLGQHRPAPVIGRS